MNDIDVHDAILNTQAAMIAQVREIKEEHEIIPCSWVEDIIRKELENLEDVLS